MLHVLQPPTRDANTCGNEDDGHQAPVGLPPKRENVSLGWKQGHRYTVFYLLTEIGNIYGKILGFDVSE